MILATNIVGLSVFIHITRGTSAEVDTPII